MQPLRAKSKQRTQIARTASMAAPTGGWYVGDNQADQPPKTAIVLNNAFPQLDYVRVRGGSQISSTGLGGIVSSLLVWTNGVSSRMFGVSAGALYDVSSSGAVGAPLVVGLGSSYLQGCQFAGFGGTYLFAVDGSDVPQIFDGTGWNRTFTVVGTLTAGTTGITGLSSTANLQNGMALSGVGIPAGATISGLAGSSATLSANATASGATALTFYQNAPITGYPGFGFSFVWTFKGRLYFVDGKTQNLYYLGLGAIGGPATLFPLGPFFAFGGYIIAGSTWAIDSTSGIYESFVVISSEGEVLMYNGDYPGAANWNLQGKYKISRPLGQNCLMKSGGDLAVMTEDGIIAMSQIMKLDQVALQNVAVTKPIAPAWRKAVIARAGVTGWQIVPWPLESMVIVNLPKLSTTDYTQFIANSRTGAWAQYLGWDANCFAVFNNQLYYGDSNGNVLQAETGASDAGVTNYTTTILMGFSELGAASVEKQVLLVKPYVLTTNPTTPQVSVSVDYTISIPAAPAPSLPTGSALWDVARWDVDVWGGGLVSQTAWLDAQGLGTAIAVCYQITTGAGAITPDVRIAAFDVLFQAGNIGLG